MIIHLPRAPHALAIPRVFSGAIVAACGLLAACTVASEDTTATDDALHKVPICTVDSEDDCTNKSGNPPLPEITYLAAAPTENGVTVSFYTPRGAVRARVDVYPAGTRTTTAGSGTDGTSGTSHTLPIGGLAACTDYDFVVVWNGVEHTSGSFKTGAAALTGSHIDRVDYRTVHLVAQTSSPIAVRATVHDTRVIPPIADRVIDLGSGMTHSGMLDMISPFETVTFGAACSAPVKLINPYVGGFPAWWLVTPAGADYDYPKNGDYAWGDSVQGAAHDPSNWFIANQYYILKVPVGTSLDQAHPEVASAPIPPSLYGGWDHYGDPDFSDGYLYVPLEGREKTGNPPRVVFLDANLNYVGDAELPSHGATNEMPWLAINSIDGLLYTSNFHIRKDNSVRKYRIDKDSTGKPTGLTFVGALVLMPEADKVYDMDINAVQGGAFSPMGHLYLSDDGGSGVQGFSVLSGRREFTMWVDYHKSFVDVPFDGTKDVGQELEGLDFWDLAPPAYAPGISGQLHVMMGHSTTGNVWFKHYGATTDAARYWL